MAMVLQHSQIKSLGPNIFCGEPRRVAIYIPGITIQRRACVGECRQNARRDVYTKQISGALLQGNLTPPMPSVAVLEYTMKYQDSWPEYQEYHAILEYQAEYQQNTTNGNTRHYE